MTRICVDKTDEQYLVELQEKEARRIWKTKRRDINQKSKKHPTDGIEVCNDSQDSYPSKDRRKQIIEDFDFAARQSKRPNFHTEDNELK